MIEKERLKIVYMGTPDFAVPPFEKLIREGYDVRLAVTQPDRPKGRGKKTRPTAVKQSAERAGVKVLQPDRIKNNEEFLDELRSIEPDLIIVAAYGKILPNTILDIPLMIQSSRHGTMLRGTLTQT